VVVAREDRDRGVGSPPGEDEEAQQHARTRLPVPRLHDHVPAGQGAELRGGEREMIAVDDRERPLARHERRDAGQRRLEERAVADEATVLLGDRGAGDALREVLEALAVAAGEDESPESVRSLVRHGVFDARPGVPVSAVRRHAGNAFFY